MNLALVSTQFAKLRLMLSRPLFAKLRCALAYTLFAKLRTPSGAVGSPSDDRTRSEESSCGV